MSNCRLNQDSNNEFT